MALTENRIRQIIREEIIIAEARRLAKDSVDDQIDSIIIGFEEDSKVVEESLKYRLRLIEAEDQKPKEESDEDDAESTTSAVGSDKRNVEDPVDPNKPKIDIDEFTTKVARFIMNFDSLLDVKTVIINRTKKFLNETYGDDELGLTFDELLRRDHDIQPTGVSDEYIQAPAAVGAGGGGGGV